MPIAIAGAGTVTGISAGGLPDAIIKEVDLEVDNSPTNDYVLTAKSSASGGLTWAAAGGGKVLQVVAANENNLLQNPTSMTTFFDLDVTPTSASSKFIVEMASFFTLGNDTEMQIICEDGTFTGGIREFRNYNTSHGARIFATATWFMDQSHSTGSAVTYAVKAHRTSGSDTAQLGSSGASYKSTMVVMEVLV